MDDRNRCICSLDIWRIIRDSFGNMVIRKVIKLQEAGGIWYHWATVHDGKKFRTDAWFVEFGERHDEIVKSLPARAERELRQMIGWHEEKKLTAHSISE